MHPRVRFIQLSFALLGVLFLIAAAFFYFHRLSVPPGTVRVTGKLLSNIRKAGDDGREQYYPRFRFETLDARPFTVTGTLTPHTTPDFVPGEEVRVFYNAADPQQARALTSSELWSIPALLGAAGAFCLLLALAIELIQEIVFRRSLRLT